MTLHCAQPAARSDFFQGTALAFAYPWDSTPEVQATYNDLFQVGHKGRPRVHLNAGDYPALAKDSNRPEILLQFSDWYRHFGLAVNDSERANDLPDHIVCQLEFMCWLGYLEANAGSEELLAGYQQAQVDFLERHLLPMLEQLVSALHGQAASSHYYTLAVDLLERCTQIHSALQQTVPIQTNNDTLPVVNLWE